MKMVNEGKKKKHHEKRSVLESVLCRNEQGNIVSIFKNLQMTVSVSESKVFQLTTTPGQPLHS